MQTRPHRVFKSHNQNFAKASHKSLTTEEKPNEYSEAIVRCIQELKGFGMCVARVEQIMGAYDTFPNLLFSSIFRLIHYLVQE